MAKLEQFATAHDALVEVLQNLPRLRLIRLLCAAAGIEMVEIDQVHERTPTIDSPAVARPARRGLADLVLVVHTSRERIWMIWVLEVQLSWDHTKQWNWAMLPVAFATKTQRTAKLAAFVPDPKLRGRIRTNLIPKILPPPLLIERDQIELIVDTEDARHRPHEAVLGAIYHVREDHPIELRVAGVQAAFVAIENLEPGQCLRYTVLMLTITPPAIAERAIDELRERGELDADRLDEIGEIERGGYLFHRAHEEGRQQGQIELLHHTIVDILELRGFVVTPEQRACVQACDDVETLQRWYAAARVLAPNASLTHMFE